MCQSEPEQGNDQEGSGSPPHSRRHSMERARADARATSGWCRVALSGVPERSAAAGRSGLQARGGRARLHRVAREGGAARLLAVALALPRGRRHVPAERQRRRRLRRGRPAGRRDGVAAPARVAGGFGEVTLVVGEQRAPTAQTLFRQALLVVVLGRAAGAAHDGAAFFDDVAWIGLAVLLGLEAAARIVVPPRRLREPPLAP